MLILQVNRKDPKDNLPKRAIKNINLGHLNFIHNSASPIYRRVYYISLHQDFCQCWHSQMPISLCNLVTQYNTAMKYWSHMYLTTTILTLGKYTEVGDKVSLKVSGETVGKVVVGGAVC